MGIAFKLFFPFNVTRVIKAVRIKHNVKVDILPTHSSAWLLN